MKQINIGLIGVGGMGTRHAHNLHQRVVGLTVAAVNDVDLERAQQVASDCGNARVFADPYALIADDHVEALLIASPDDTHAEYTLACLREGKPVLCEKPLATNAADAGRVVEAEMAVGRQLIAVGFMRRYDPQHIAVKQAVDSGIIGRPILFKGVHRNAEVPPRFSAGLIINGSAVHDIDSARWLLGQEVEIVYVRGVRTEMSLQEDVCDLALLQISLTNDTLATIEVYVTAGYGYEVRAEVVGERGTAVTMPPDHIALRVKSTRSHPVPADWLARFQDAYLAELNQWALALRGQPFRGASAWDGYLSLLAADACLKSLRSGKPEPASCPVIPELYRQ